MSDQKTEADIDRERDEVVRKMLNTPPAPQRPKRKKAKVDKPKT
jgi:hypothetical protein